MNHIRKVWDSVLEWIQDAILGFGTAIPVSLLWQEAFHILSIIIGGLLSTIAIHYLNKLLKK